jgi:hypothetical protein
MKSTLLLLALSVSFSLAQAQDLTVTEPASNSLEEHFENLKRGANHYKENNRQYKVIEMTRLNSFWDNVLATIKTREANILQSGKTSVADLQKANITIGEQAKEIASLKQKNALNIQAVEQNAFEVNNISILGLGINKQVFMIFSFGSIAALLVLAGALSSVNKKNKKVTDEKIQAYQGMELELTEFKKAARERELKIKRELQTEMNHKEELRQQLASLQKQSHV